MLRLTYVFIILIKFPPKKLRAVKVEQLNFLSENLKEIFPPQLPGRKYVTESSLGIIAREKGIDKKLLFGAAQGFNSLFLNLFGFSISVSFVWCII